MALVFPRDLTSALDELTAARVNVRLAEDESGRARVHASAMVRNALMSNQSVADLLDRHGDIVRPLISEVLEAWKRELNYP